MIKLRKPPFLIAEIGINHNGSLKLAKKMIDIAKRNNFSAVKFQKRNPDISTPEKQKEQLTSPEEVGDKRESDLSKNRYGFQKSYHGSEEHKNVLKDVIKETTKESTNA